MIINNKRKNNSKSNSNSSNNNSIYDMEQQYECKHEQIHAYSSLNDSDTIAYSIWCTYSYSHHAQEYRVPKFHKEMATIIFLQSQFF